MKIIDIKHVDIGANGSVINELQFDNNVTPDFISYLSNTGNYQYFVPPIYKIQHRDFFTIKGFLGSNKAQLQISKNCKKSLQYFKDLIGRFKS